MKGKLSGVFQLFMKMKMIIYYAEYGSVISMNFI